MLARPAASGLDSQWVAFGSSGELEYKQTTLGDRITDFSHAGYMGGGVAIPDVPAKILVSPSGGDDTDAIQAAIDLVSAMPLDGEHRGAVQLERGVFRCAGTLTIRASGVVLRGSGSGRQDTVIEMNGEPHRFLEAAIPDGDEDGFQEAPGATAIRIMDEYVPSGTIILSLEDASGLREGDRILIRRPISSEWISFMGMDRLVRDGQSQTWIRPGRILTFERRVRAIRENRIALDMPLSDCIDARFAGDAGAATVVKAAPCSRLSQVGVESLRLVSAPPRGDLTVKKYNGVEFSHCRDCWVRDLSSYNPVTIVRVNSSDCTRITLQKIDIQHERPIEKGAGYPADFLVRGSRVLIDRCTSKGDGAFFYSSLGLSETSAVILDCDFHGKGSIQPHMRWNTGLLVDSCRVPDGGISFQNRQTAGSGHGWTIGWAVAWNCEAQWFENEQPPGAFNWVIGCSGKQESGENYLSHGKHVRPGSLYLAQLQERSGLQAVKNIGHG